MAIAYLAFGSNLGNRKENIQQAIDLLKQNNIKILAQSSIIETNPVGYADQGLFLNGALKVQTEHSPEDLLAICNTIEDALGRERIIKDGPRTIDLDILLYDQVQLNASELIIPHPRMWERDFVMTPLKEIYPEVKKCDT